MQMWGMMKSIIMKAYSHFFVQQFNEYYNPSGWHKYKIYLITPIKNWI